MKKYSHHTIAFVIITLLVGILAWTNHVPGTMLAGWDDLHHEFNFPLAFTRTIQGVWRADQGLGAVAGHSHMSDLPRIAVLWFISLVVPFQNIRFVFVILSLFVGATGMYRLVYCLFAKKAKFSPTTYSVVALISTFVYVLNLGTVQQFILPFEMFMVQFALLPWLISSASVYVHTPKARHLLIFAIVSLLFSPTAYAATLWYVFFGICIAWLVFQKPSVKCKSLLMLGIVFVLMNLYWLLPNVYFAKNHGEEVQTSKINTIFSPDMFQANKQFGTVKDALILKSFLFDWQMYDYDAHAFPQIMESWKSHLDNPIALGAGYAVSLLAIGGVLFAVWRKDKHIIPYIVFLGIPFILLLNGTWPISVLYEKLGLLSPLLKEALRTPFTKVSIPAGFGLAIFVGYFLLQLRGVGKVLFRLCAVFATASILYFALPAFRGGYIHRLVQVNIPSAYFEMFSYFQNQPKHSRVALLPIHTFWNWTYYTWGYQGAGFLQFGIEQPLLDRDYGRWNTNNEQYNREMSYALYSQNPEILAQIIKKYDIEYVVLDTSVFEPSLTSQHSLLSWISPLFLQETKLFESPQQFGISLFVYKRKNQITHDVTISQGIPTAVPLVSNKSPVDFTYLAQGDYISTPEASASETSEPYFVKSADVDHTIVLDLTKVESHWDYCADRKNTQSGRSIAGSGVTYTSIDTNICETFVFSELPHDKSYVLEVQSTNVVGRPLNICVKNMLTEHCDLFEQLQHGAGKTVEYLHLPRLWDYGVGYQVELSNIARGRGTSVNTLEHLEIQEVNDPMISQDTESAQTAPADVSFESNFMRVIRNIPEDARRGDSTLIFDQAYEPGWIGLEMHPGKLSVLPHLKVNGWANGWKINRTESVDQGKKSTIILLFWPQYLEYGGFGVGGLTLLMLTVKMAKNSRKRPAQT